MISACGTSMDLESLIREYLPDATLISVKGVDVTIASAASPKAIFDAEAAIRNRTGIKYELFMSRKGDLNKQRIKLARLRGVKT